MASQQGLVGCHHRLAGLERGPHGRKRGIAVAADQLDEDIDVGRSRQGHGIVEPLGAAKIQRARLGSVSRRDAGHQNGPARPLLKRRLLQPKSRQNRGADGAEAGQPDAQG